MDRSSGFLPFMDILTGLMGIIILINIVLSLSLADGQDIKVRIIPKDENIAWHDKSMKPVMVVCASNHVMLQKSRISMEEMKARARFHRKITDTIEKGGANAYLLALIRPDGYRSFRYVRAAAKALDIRIGYEPIDENWEMVY